MIYDPDKNTFNNHTGKSLSGYLPHVMWHITDECPLGCSYCYAPKSDPGVNSQQIPFLLNFLRKLKVQKIDVTGGEPLIYRDLPFLIEQTRQFGFYQTITTSGVGTKSNRDYVVEHIDYFTRLLVSIDAPTEQAHNNLRHNKLVWKRLNSLLERIPSEKRRQYLRVNTVITRPFVENNWIQPMAEFVSKLDIREWCIIQPHPANEKPDYHKFDIDDSIFLSVLEQARLLTKNTNLIFRQRDLYSTYWVLQPRGTLNQHSSSALDEISIDLTQTPISEVNRIISGTTTNVPTNQ